MMKNKLIEFFLFPNIPSYKRYILAVIYVIILLTGPILLGGFTNNSSDHELYIRIRNAAIGQPLFTVYIWLAHTHIFFTVTAAINKFSLALNDNSKFDKQKAINKLTRTSIRNFKLAVLLGIFTTGAYNWLESLIPKSPDPIVLYMIISAVPFWIAAWLLTLQLYTITHHIINEIIKNQAFDLFGLKTLLPLSDQFVTFIIVTALLFVLSPIFWIGKEVPLVDILLLSVFFIFLCVFFFHPILKIQSRMYQKKKLAVQRINKTILELLHNDNDRNKRLTDEPERLRQLSALINAKREIANTSEWAISLPQQIRGVVIVASIPLSWVAASMIESAISTLTYF